MKKFETSRPSVKRVRLLSGQVNPREEADLDQIGVQAWNPVIYAAGEDASEGLLFIQFVLEQKVAQKELQALPALAVQMLPGVNFAPPARLSLLPRPLQPCPHVAKGTSSPNSSCRAREIPKRPTAKRRKAKRQKPKTRRKEKKKKGDRPQNPPTAANTSSPSLAACTSTRTASRPVASRAPKSSSKLTRRSTCAWPSLPPWQKASLCSGQSWKTAFWETRSTSSTPLKPRMRPATCSRISKKAMDLQYI